MTCFISKTSADQRQPLSGGVVLDQGLRLDLLAKDIEQKMKERKLSLRDAAAEIGCSAATLSRMLKGEEAPNQPDTTNVIRAASWVGKGLAQYDPSKQPTTSTIADVEVHLRALPGLSERDKDALVAMVRAAHDQYGSHRKKK